MDTCEREAIDWHMGGWEYGTYPMTRQRMANMNFANRIVKRMIEKRKQESR
jgi:hypothetical protein